MCYQANQGYAKNETHQLEDLMIVLTFTPKKVIVTIQGLRGPVLVKQRKLYSVKRNFQLSKPITLVINLSSSV